MSTISVPAVRSASHASVDFPGKYLSVTSFRSDGTPVATPVWFVEDGGTLYVDTDGSSYKVRRISANPAVLIAPCGPSGRLKAEPVAAHAEVQAEMPRSARARYERKYRIDRVFVLPLYRLVQALRGNRTVTGDSVALVITPGH